MTSKYLIVKHKVNPIDLAFISQAIGTGIGLSVGIFRWTSGAEIFEPSKLFWGFFGGLFQTLAFLCAFNAFKKGPVGPIQSLNNL
jgi:hypothetical protein